LLARQSTAIAWVMGAEEADPSSACQQRTTIWIVGDAMADTNVAARALVDFSTQMLAGGEELFAALASGRPDVLLVCCDSADACLTICSRVRELHDGMALPILLLIPSPLDRADVERAFHAGASDVMASPFLAGELIARITAVARLARLALEAREAHARAEAANQMKDRFLATVSHELRTPLNAILGWTVLLREQSPPEDIDRVLATIERNARTQSRLIEDVLDFSRSVTGKLRLELGPTNVGEVLDAAVEAVRPGARSKNIQLDVDIDETIGLILADRDRLQQVVWNLLANAVKFTPKEGHITLQARRSSGEVTLVVRDSGPGIPAEFLKDIFEPFQQADGTMTRRQGGLGLGLAIVSQLVDAHAGTIEVESKERKGTTFTVHLPAQDVPILWKSGTRASPKAVGERPKTLPRVDGMKVLVVEDDADSRGLLVHLLKQQGAETREAGSALDALRMFEDFAPNILVSDIGMPHVDGLSLMRKIRSLPPARGGGIPAIALTAFVREEDARQAFAAGFQDHLAKPVEPAVLLETLRRVSRQIGGVRSS
jgi:signal transduction histidine kinase/ActR/RegA family two-component response regulator